MGPQPGHKRQASRTIVLIPLPEQVGPTPTPSRPGWGLSYCSLWMCEAKGLERGPEQKWEEKGGCLSLPPPHCFKGSLFPSQRKGITFKKSPHWI